MEKLKVLQLCCFTNFWPVYFEVESWDLKNNRDVFDIDPDYVKNFDIVAAAPPCVQFTKANSSRWQDYPVYYVNLARHCFTLCLSSQCWFFENPPGRIEKFIPDLSYFRIMTWSGSFTNKEYVVYSNQLFLYPYVKRYGKEVIPRNQIKRQEWQPDFMDMIIKNIILL